MHAATASPDAPPADAPSAPFAASHLALAASHLAVIAIGLAVGTLYALFAVAFGGRAPGLSLAMLRAHGVTSVFLCVVPALPTTLGNALLPSLVGARTVAFPRLAQAALALHALGLAALVVALQHNATSASWTLSMAWSPAEAQHSVLWLVVSVIVLAVSVAMNALNTLVTVTRLRDAEHPWSALSPMVWGLAGAATINLAVAPVAVLLGLLVLAERTVGLGLFDPTLGGDPLLYNHAVWLYLHPAVVGTLVAAIGAAAHVLRPRGAKGDLRLGVALLGLSLVSLFGWGQHLYHLATRDFAVLESSLAAVAFQIPLLWVLGRMVLGLRRGLALDTAARYALAFVAHFAIIAPTGLVLALPSTSVAFEASTFSTGHLHYVTAGGALFALLAALHRAWPRLTGRAFDAARANVAMALLTVGVNASFLAMLVDGGRGVPRPALPHGFASLTARVASGLGGTLALAGLVLAAAVLTGSVLRGAPAATDALDAD